jgi:Chalcone isomerase-like
MGLELVGEKALLTGARGERAMVGTRAFVVAAAIVAAAPSWAEDFTEPKSGVTFPLKRDAGTLLGAGLRVKKIAFVKVKVYAAGLYVGDDALSGPLAVHRGKTGTAAFYKELVWGDFPKEIVLHFTRDLGQERIQDAMREALSSAEKGPLDTFVSYFPEVRTGEECVLRWGAGGVLDAVMAGKPKPPIANKAFAAAVFALYLGETPLQDDLKTDLVSRAAQVLGP